MSWLSRCPGLVVLLYSSLLVSIGLYWSLLVSLYPCWRVFKKIAAGSRDVNLEKSYRLLGTLRTLNLGIRPIVGLDA